MPLIISAADLKKQNKINVPNFQGAWYCASSLICRQFRWGTNLWAPMREEWCITLRTMRSCLDGEEKHSALPELNLATARRGVNTCCVYLCNYWKRLMFSLYHSFGPQFSFGKLQNKWTRKGSAQHWSFNSMTCYHDSRVIRFCILSV